MPLGTSLPARIPQCSGSQVRYIAPSGNDTTGTGTEASPWKTPNKAFGMIAASGGLILCRGGTYTLSGQQNWNRAGSSSDPVQIKAYPGETPVFTGAFRFMFTGQYLRFGPGLQLIGPGAPDLMKVTSGGTRIEVVGNKNTMQTTTDFSEGLLVTEGDGPGNPIVQVWDCEFVGNGSFVTNKNHCIYLSDVGAGCVVANSVFRDLAAGYGVQMNPGPGVIVTCCTFDANSNRGGIVFEGTTGSRAIACIITNMQTGTTILSGGSGNNVSDCIGDNVGTDFDTDPAVTNTNNLSGTDPLYTNAGANDFTLQEDSPAFNLVPGAREGFIPVLDKAGNPRTTADAGAYAAGDSTPPPDPGTAPSNTSLPVISGALIEGQVLSVTNGTWAGSAATYTRQWMRCDEAGESCSDIVGQTGTTYALVSADVDSTIRCEVTATNAYGSSAATSAQTGVIGGSGGSPGAPPVNVSPPTISGIYQNGQTLTGSPGTWDANGVLTFAYQWLRCDQLGGNCQVIAGAQGTSYTINSSDIGRRLRLRVTAINVLPELMVTLAASPQTGRNV